MTRRPRRRQILAFGNVDPRNRGVEGILIAVGDGLKGFPEAINAVFPGTEVQSCIIRLVRHCVTFCGWKDRKTLTKSLKRICQEINHGIAF